MTDARTLLTRATDEPPAADPVGGVRAAIARRHRARRAVAAGSAAVVVVAAGGLALATRSATPTQEVRPVSSVTPAPLPSGGSERATTPPDDGVDTANPGLVGLGELVTAHTAVFVGTYVDDDGVAVVAFGPGVDAGQWEGRLRDAAGTQAWRTTRCPYAHEELARVQGGLESFGWPSKRPAFGAWIDAKTCSVLLTSDEVTPADIDALRSAYGDRLTVDTSGHPTRR